MNETAVLDQPKAAKPRKRRWLYRVLWATLALIVGAGLYWSWARHSALVERDALIAELHAKGQPVWWNEVVDKALAEQPEDSGGPLFREALTAIEQVSRQFSPSFSTRRDAREFRRELFEQEKPSAEVTEALRLAAPATALLEEAVRRKPRLLTSNSRDISGQTRPVILGLTALNRVLNLKVQDALVRNNANRAYQSAALALQCAEQYSVDPDWMGLTAGLSVRTTACECLLECLARVGPPDEDFRKLDQLLAAYDDGFNVAHVFQGERARDLDLLESGVSMKERLGWRSAFMRAPDHWTYTAWLWALSSPIGAPIRLKTEVQFLEVNRRIAPLIDRPDGDTEAIEDLWKDFLKGSALHRSIEYADHLFGDTLVGSQKMLRRMHQRLILTRLALRLRRYHDRHGKFADKLDDLCDAAMPKIRLDWFGGQPITYKPSAKGFRLELPRAIVPSWEQYHLDKTPIPNEYGLEVELKQRPMNQ
jgi:hypothetical protein